LPDDQRAEVAKFVMESDDSWIPEPFKHDMADAEAGRFADINDVLNDAPPPSCRKAKWAITSDRVSNLRQSRRLEIA
jgi:hypothetical protein